MPNQYIAILSCPELSAADKTRLHADVRGLGGSSFFRLPTSTGRGRMTLPDGAFAFDAGSAREVTDRLDTIALPAQAAVALKVDFAVIEVTGDSCFGGVEVDEHGTRLFREDRADRTADSFDGALAVEA